jgi:hypothetical protein
MQAFDYVTNRMSNMTATTELPREVSSTVQVLNHVPIKHDWRTLPLQMLVLLAFVAAVSTAVIYPGKSPTLILLGANNTDLRAAYERKSHVRALQYSNGVSPLALWIAYLLFDIQFILIEGKYHR